MNKVTKVVSEVFCPSNIKCILCDGEIFTSNRYNVCANCELPINDVYCECCGKKLQTIETYCNVCKRQSRDFTYARSPLYYDDAIKRSLYRLKYNGGQYLSEVFGMMLADLFSILPWQVDVVTFVPMHIKRLRKRGYNQAELIAREFSKHTGLILVDCLKRIKHTPNLARMNAAMRAETIKGAISARAGMRFPKRILLIDDVFTSGTTIGECANVLKSVGVEEIYVLTVASTAEKAPAFHSPDLDLNSHLRALKREIAELSGKKQTRLQKLMSAIVKKIKTLFKP